MSCQHLFLYLYQPSLYLHLKGLYLAYLGSDPPISPKPRLNLLIGIRVLSQYNQTMWYGNPKAMPLWCLHSCIDPCNASPPLVLKFGTFFCTSWLWTYAKPLFIFGGIFDRCSTWMITPPGASIEEKIKTEVSYPKLSCYASCYPLPPLLLFRTLRTPWTIWNI